MEFDLIGNDAGNAYKLLAGLVTPRPIALTTTVDEEGRVNAAPFSFFNVFGSNPPILCLAPGNREPGVPKDTARNIRMTGEFVVNLVDEDIAEAMSRCATPLPPGESELALAGLTAATSSVVAPLRIAESPVSMECREFTTMEIGANRLVIGTIHRMHVRDGILDADSLQVNMDAFHPVGRMKSPSSYCRTRDWFDMVI